MTDPFAVQHINIHGHQVCYRMAGRGPAVVLLHGLAGSSTTWRHVMPDLVNDYTVLAPDLLGHGESAKPRGDYSLGAYASGVRDLMVALGIERASFVGHSIGGGIAMQLAYQFPQRCERLILVSSGGLGKEVTPFLKVVALPGVEYILPLVLSARLHSILEAIGSPFRRIGLHLDDHRAELWRSYTSLTTTEGRAAFLTTVREVVDLAGQRISANDRLYLAAGVPTLIVWGDEDRIIPVAHAHDAHDAIPGSRLEILSGAGHFLPFEDSGRFVAVLRDFLATTEPGITTEEAFRLALLRASEGDPEAAAAC